MQEKICTFAPVMKRIVLYSKKCVCIGLAAVALQASAADNERAICSDLSLGTSEKFAEANGLLADSSRVYDIDEVVVVPGSLLNGFICIVESGYGSPSNVFSAMKDENTIIFRLTKNGQAEKMKRLIEARL